MRFSLKDILAIVAFTAVVLACASAFGFADRVFWISAGAAFGLSALFVALMRRHSGLGFAAGATILAFALGLALASATVAVNALLLFFAVVYFAGFSKPRGLRTLAMIAALVLLTAIVTGTFFRTGELRKM